MTAPVWYLLSIVTVCQAAGGTLAGQAPQEAQRRLSAGLTGCDSSLTVPSDSVYEADAVDQPVRASRLNIQWMPVRVGHILRGHTTLRFIVEQSGKINRCSIALLEEEASEWTDAVVRELRSARYRPARRGDEHVRQWVEQIFTYYNDARPSDSR